MYDFAANADLPKPELYRELAIAAEALTAGEPDGVANMANVAALLLVTAWFMAEPERWGERLRLPNADLALSFGTAALTVLVDLTVAILVGTAIGLILRRWHR